MMNESYVDSYGRTHTLTKMLNCGGQGVVYRTDEPNVLVKLEWNPETQEIIMDSAGNVKFEDIRLLPIFPKTNITVPQSVLKEAAGYTMKLLDDMTEFSEAFSGNNVKYEVNDWLKGFEEFNPELMDLFGRYIATGGLKKRLESYLEVACILGKLHASGLVYCDVSDKNMFVSEKNNRSVVWLIDCDNLDYMKNTAKKGGWRTPGFGAPEVIKGKGNTMYSDCFSFSVALYWNTVGQHPFMGNAVNDALDEEDFLDVPEEDYACNGEFPWILDEEDDSNQSENGLPADLFFSKDVLKCFEKTFGNDGRNNRQKRTTMPEWAYVLAKELDHNIRCKTCGMDYHIGVHNICPWCDGKNKITKVYSYEKTDEIKWEYICEADDKKVYVPMRILNGFSCEELVENSFSIQIKDEKIEIDNLTEKFDFAIESTLGMKNIYGKTVLNKNDLIRIVATNKNNGRVLYINVEG